MRRILKNLPVDKTTEKKKRDALIESIAVEQTTKARIQEEIDEKKAEIKTLEKNETKAREQVEFWKKAAADAERVFKELEAKVGPLYTRVEEMEARLGTLLKEEVEVRQSIRAKQTELMDNLISLREDFDEEERRLNNEIALIERKKADQEARLMVLSRSGDLIADELAKKESEKQAIDESLTNRMKELTTINMNLTQTKNETERAKKELDNIDSKLSALRIELAEKDKKIIEKTEEIQKQEAVVLNLREQLVQLSAKEKRIQELIPAIEELYNRAGLKVKI